MRLIKFAILFVIAFCIVLLGVANRDPVTVNLLPDAISGYVPFPTAITLPLFLHLMIMVVIGLALGFLWEWLREMRHRHRAHVASREAAQLEAENKRLKKKAGEHEDDVLAIVS